MAERAKQKQPIQIREGGRMAEDVPNLRGLLLSQAQTGGHSFGNFSLDQQEKFHQRGWQATRNSGVSQKNKYSIIFVAVPATAALLFLLIQEKKSKEGVPQSCAIDKSIVSLRVGSSAKAVSSTHLFDFCSPSSQWGNCRDNFLRHPAWLQATDEEP